MNYLAHIFLSGVDEEIMIGNFIGDYIKGKEYNRYPLAIQKGIMLHRGIDSYTDSHKIVHQSMSYFAPRYRKYAGIIIDVLYDHFLAVNWDKFSPQPLEEYKEYIFETLKKYHSVLPERVQFFIPSFIKNDWIGAYSSIDGILAVFYRMSMRTSLPNESEYTREILRKYYIQLQSEFLTFFPEIIHYVVEKQSIKMTLKDNQFLDIP